MRTILIILLAFSCFTSFGQSLERQVIGSAGMDVSTAQVKLGFTVGEAVTRQGAAGSVLLTQGFQQMDTTDYADVRPILSGLPELSVYPNPTASILNVRISGLQERGLIRVRLRVLDMNGRQVMLEELPSIGGQLHVGDLAASTYVVQISTLDGDVLHRLRFVKYE